MTGRGDRLLPVALWLLRPAVTAKLCPCRTIPRVEATHRQREAAGPVLADPSDDLRMLPVELEGHRSHPATTSHDSDNPFIPQGK
jgi:hypothetical protein